MMMEVQPPPNELSKVTVADLNGSGGGGEIQFLAENPIGSDKFGFFVLPGCQAPSAPSNAHRCAGVEGQPAPPEHEGAEESICGTQNWQIPKFIRKNGQ